MEGARHGGEGSVGARCEDLDAAGDFDEGLVLQVPLDEGDGGVIELGEIGEGALLDLAVLAAGTSKYGPFRPAARRWRRCACSGSRAGVPHIHCKEIVP